MCLLWIILGLILKSEKEIVLDIWIINSFIHIILFFDESTDEMSQTKKKNNNLSRERKKEFTKPKIEMSHKRNAQKYRKTWDRDEWKKKQCWNGLLYGNKTPPTHSRQYGALEHECAFNQKHNDEANHANRPMTLSS